MELTVVRMILLLVVEEALSANNGLGPNLPPPPYHGSWSEKCQEGRRNVWARYTGGRNPPPLRRQFARSTLCRIRVQGRENRPTFTEQHKATWARTRQFPLDARAWPCVIMQNIGTPFLLCCRFLFCAIML